MRRLQLHFSGVVSTNMAANIVANLWSAFSARILGFMFLASAAFLSSVPVHVQANTEPSLSFVQGQTTAMWRLYSPILDSFVDVPSKDSYDFLISVGWQGRGIAYQALSEPGHVDGVPTMPMYRLYSQSIGTHYYAQQKWAYDYLASVGWKAEGVRAYVLTRPTPSTVALERYYHPQKIRHYFSIDPADRIKLPAAGWQANGVVGYVLPPDFVVTPKPLPVIQLDISTALGTIPLAVFSLMINTSDAAIAARMIEYFATNSAGVTTRLGQSTGPEHSLTIPNLQADTYDFYARGSNSNGSVVTSNRVTISIRNRPASAPANVVPMVSVVSPVNGAILTAGTPISLRATASDADGVIARLVYRVNGTKVGEANWAPFELSWTPTMPGTYTVTATVTDDASAQVVSVPVVVAVIATVITSPPPPPPQPANQAPMVLITAPANNTVVTAGTLVSIAATATDADGSVSKVEFFANGVKLGECTATPYTFSWITLSAATYALTAKVTDNANATTISATVNIVVNVAVPPPLPPANGAVTPQAAARFLTQASFGPNMNAINEVVTKGYVKWLDDQLLMPMANPSHWKYVMIDKGPNGESKYINSVMESFWLQAVRGNDQLRQRTVFALTELFVVSTVNGAVDIQEGAHASYLDMLSRNAFGNFRTLLEQVSTHPTMALYLTFFANEKEDPVTGKQPDENYAREVMQLFTVGLWQLNQDGSRQRDANGKFIPTYGQADVRGMARALTGWGWGQEGISRDYTGWNAPIRWDLPMDPYPIYHSSSEKRILNGVVIPPNTDARVSMKIALDTLFNHQNVGPFIGSQLIKRLVTSNPSPAYVSRVAGAFNNNGSGVRGDMKAVIRAVLLDPEARDAAKLSVASWGKLREPIVRYANYMRAFDLKSSSGIYQIWNLEDPVDGIGQNPLRSPSVFNWFRPDYAPPGPILNMGLVAPEFQITHETTLTGYTNFITSQAAVNTNWWRGPYQDRNTLIADHTAEMALTGNPGALADRLNLLLLYGQMSPTLRANLIAALNNIPLTDSLGAEHRVETAIILIMSSPEFVVQK